MLYVLRLTLWNLFVRDTHPWQWVLVSFVVMIPAAIVLYAKLRPGEHCNVLRQALVAWLVVSVATVLLWHGSVIQQSSVMIGALMVAAGVWPKIKDQPYE